MRLYTTTTIRKPERFTFWRDLVSDKVIGLDIEQVAPHNSFFGTVQSARIGAMQFACVQSISQVAARSRQQISKSNEDANVFCFDLAGNQRLSGQNIDNDLNTGDWVALDSTRPFRWFFPDAHTQLTVKIAKEKLRNRACLPDRPVAQHFSGRKGLGKIVFEIITSFWNQAQWLPESAHARLEEFVVELLANVLADSTQGREKRNHSHDLRKLEVKAFVADHLRNPELSVDAIASRLNLSSRYLYALFKDEDKTIACHIRELRLSKCRQDLENPRLAERSVTEICYYWGFNDSAHFSKLFKSRFGMSPKYYRSQWLADLKRKQG